MSEQPLRWAVFGAGGMGRWHVDALLARPDVRLVAACDVNPLAMDRLPDGVARFTDWRALLDATDLDGASVILPHDLYPEIVVALLRRGIHVLKEKPFARDLADALAMCRAARAANQRLVVSGQRKFLASFLTARQRLPELGGIFLTRASILYRLDRIVLEGQWGWRGERRRSGGVALLDSGWHILEMLTLCRGVPSRVTAATGQMRISAGDFDADEQAALILDYPDGGIALVLSSFVTAPSELRLTFYGKNGTLDADLSQGRVTLSTGATVQELEVGTVPEPAVQLYDQFLDSIRSGKPCPGNWAEAIQVQCIIEAGYRSVARGGTPVSLEEVPASVADA